MADENIQVPPAPTDGFQRSADLPPQSEHPPAEDAPVSEANPYRKSPAQLAWGGALALLAFAACTYVLFRIFVMLFGTGVLSYLAPFIITLVVFAVLERNLVLSRLFGLQTGADSSPLRTVLSWIVPLAVGPSAPAHAQTAAHAERGEAASSRSRPVPATPEPKDLVREVAETVVFVVVLVLLLKTFVAEAFVIPTGSMATTLWGYQTVVTCPQCEEKFPVNSSDSGRPISIRGCVCPNCRYDIDFAEEVKKDPNWKIPDYNTGDRVLVAKFIYDSHIPKSGPNRDDVVVFKYPVAPQQNHEPMNYIKRLVGLPGETIAIYCGKLYETKDLNYAWRDPPPGEWHEPQEHGIAVLDLPKARLKACYENDPRAVKLFHDSLANPNLKERFHIVRKAPDVVLAMSRLVYDNDHQAKDLATNPKMQRWTGDGTWAPDKPELPKRFDHSGEMGWLRYRHILRDNSDNPKSIPDNPQLITDFMGYNTRPGRGIPSQNWVSDLILECDVEVASVNPGDEVVLELAKGPDRFQVRFHPENGDCTLFRHRTVGQKFDKELGAQTGTRLKGPGKYHVRLANVDDRLTVWVDGDLPFGDGVAYEAAKDQGPVAANDLKPAAIAVRGSAAISKLQLRRDTYYTVDPSSADVSFDPGDANTWFNSDPDKSDLRKRPVKTLFVQPDHYLCMGDNSPESADGRSWGLVPERLMLGRALVVYFPFYPFGPETRVRTIK